MSVPSSFIVFWTWTAAIQTQTQTALPVVRSLRKRVTTVASGPESMCLFLIALGHFSHIISSADPKCHRADQRKMPDSESLSKLTPLAAIPGYKLVEVVGRGTYGAVYVSTSTNTQ